MVLAAAMCLQACGDEIAEGGSVNGHEYVDLGLSVKWATCNVGADNPQEYGDYFAWGETSPKETYTSDNSATHGNGNIGDISGKAKYDAATAAWGGSWRMPTRDEMNELLTKCNWLRTTEQGVPGFRITSKDKEFANNSIFLPAAGWFYETSILKAGELGYYWCSSPYENTTVYAQALYFDENNAEIRQWARRYGRSIRPVTK